MTVSRGDTVTLEYVGRLADRDHDPLTVEAGEGRVLEGLEVD